MKINNFSNINFRSIVQIKSLTNPKEYLGDNARKIDSSTSEVISVLNNEETFAYSKQAAKVIRNLHRSYIKDYDGENAIARRVRGNIYLITGEDIDKIERTESVMAEEQERIRKDNNISDRDKEIHIITADVISDSYIANGAQKDSFIVYTTADDENMIGEQEVAVKSTDTKLNCFSFAHFNSV